jgi:curli biogenesis system outer membrane secretion channel CsgG
MTTLRQLLKCGLLLAAVVCAGCSTSIAIQVLKPAELDIPPFKKVAVLDFDLTGAWHFWYDNEKLSLEEIARKVLIAKLGLDRSQRPHPKKAFAGSEMSTRLIAGLVQNGHYEVLERAALGRVLSEHSLSQSGLIDESQAARIGKLSGVDAILIGSGTYSVNDGGQWNDYQEKIQKQVAVGDSGASQTVEETVTVRKFDAFRDVTLDVTYRIVEISTGRVIAAQTNRSSSRLSSRQLSEPQAWQSLPDWRPALSGLADNLTARTVQQIAPYYVNQSRKIKSGKSQDMKSALQYAKRGMIEDARGLWEQVAVQSSSNMAKDRLAAQYNLGIYAEVVGDLDKAEQRFEACYKASGKAEFLDERMRIQARKREVERLKLQQAGQ